MTNYTDHVRVVSVNHALETLDGRLSYHKILQIDSVLPCPKSFSWEVHEYLKTSKESDAKLLSLLRERDWGSVAILAPLTVEFHRVLDELMLQCYLWKRVRRKTSDKPWVSDGLRSSIKKVSHLP